MVEGMRQEKIRSDSRHADDEEYQGAADGRATEESFDGFVEPRSVATVAVSSRIRAPPWV